MKGKAVIPLVLGLCVGLVAVKFLVDTIQRAKGANAASKTVQIVRALEDIDSFQEIRPEQVEVIEAPDSKLAPSAERVSSTEAVIGRVTSKFIPANSPILQSMLAPDGTPPGMVGRIPPGYRAVSVKIDEVTGVAYQLKPGDWVDVIVVMDIDPAGTSRRRETIAEVILQKVQVAAIGQGMTTPQPSSGSVKPAKSATLLVRDEDVPKLHLAATRGKITLSMRGEEDTETGNPMLASSDDVFTYGKRHLMNQGSMPTAGPAKTDTGPSLVGMLLTKMMTPKVEPRPMPAQTFDGTMVQEERKPPYGVVVYRNSPGEGPVAQHIIFEDGESRTIVALHDGPIDRASAIVGAGPRVNRFEDRFNSSSRASRKRTTGSKPSSTQQEAD